MNDNEHDRPMVLYQTSRGRIINLLLVESMQAANPNNSRQPYGVYMSSGIFHTLDEEEFDFLVSNYAEICTRPSAFTLLSDTRLLRRQW